MKQGRFLPLAACAAAVCVATMAHAQLPVTQLTSIFPPGGKAGASVDVTIAGADMDDALKLVFNHTGLAATPKMSVATALMPARPIDNQFTVKISNDVPPGTYEVQALGRFGLSNPRSFVVGAGNEAVEPGGNTSADKALDVPLGTTVNGRVDANTFEYLRLNLKRGERVLVEVAARRIDSRLDGTLVILDSAGRELKRTKQGAGADPVLEFTAPTDGAYLLKLYDEVYGGGNDYFYRLTASAGPFVDFVFPPSGIDESVHAVRPQFARIAAGRWDDDWRRCARKIACEHLAARCSDGGCPTGAVGIVAAGTGLARWDRVSPADAAGAGKPGFDLLRQSEHNCC
jgi:hypothetical protein